MLSITKHWACTIQSRELLGPTRQPAKGRMKRPQGKAVFLCDTRRAGVMEDVVASTIQRLHAPAKYIESVTTLVSLI